VLFNSARPHGVEDCVKNIEGKIPPELGVQLLVEFTAEEVHSALFQMEPEKALGLDGLSDGFYQQHWETVGTEVCTAVLFFLNSAIMDVI
jgi:hypothetical protein